MRFLGNQFIVVGIKTSSISFYWLFFDKESFNNNVKLEEQVYGRKFCYAV